MNKKKIKRPNTKSITPTKIITYDFKKKEIVGTFTWLPIDYLYSKDTNNHE